MLLQAMRQRLAQRRADIRARPVVVLAGGSSAEREISLVSGRAVADGLQQLGIDARLLLVNPDDVSFALPERHAELEADAALPAAGEQQAGTPTAAVATTRQLSLLAELRGSGIVFTTLHGTRGEDGVWQGLLELLRLPYVSAGVKGSALAMDKLTAKRLCASLGVPTAEYWVERRSKSCRALVPPTMTELVAKPASQGSSVGIEMITNDDAGWAAVHRLVERFDPLLIERRLHGREFTAAVIGPTDACLALPLVEIKPRREFYDYTAKYTAGQTEYCCPADLDQTVAGVIQEYAQRIYCEFELEPYSRMDFILDAENQPWFLEANTLPGFTPLSLVPQAARAAGIEFGELLELLLLFALERWERERGASHG